MCAIRLGYGPIEFRLRNQIRPGEELRMQHSRRAMPGQSVEAYLAGIPESIRAGWPVPSRLSSDHPGHLDPWRGGFRRTPNGSCHHRH